MTTFRLFGTLTSPYVRRVRIVAAELGLTAELVDTFTDEGQAALRAINPAWKVPSVEIEGQAIFDSRVICEHLVNVYGPGPLTASSADVAETNQQTVTDAALDALINVFYLGRDGVTADQASYLDKQRARATSCMTWLEERVSASERFGLSEIGLVTALDWMRFRDTYPVDDHPRLAALLARHAGRASVVVTRPPTQ